MSLKYLRPRHGLKRGRKAFALNGEMMEIAAIIAEYNPLHNGHVYHINETRRVTNADAVAVVMSGNFVERGEPAVMNKYARARHAVENGADIVVELPAFYATSAAKYFAEGAIKTINNISGVKFLSFGSESGDLESLEFTAEATETEEFGKTVREFMKKGLSYPAAHGKAIEVVTLNALKIGGNNSENIGTYYKNMPKIDINRRIPELCDRPNDMLALEYIKAIKKFNLSIIPVAVKRVGSGYRELTLENMPSAAAIRKAVADNRSVDGFLPESVAETLIGAPKIGTERLFAVIAARLADNPDMQITEDNEGILNRLRKAAMTSRSYEEFISRAHTKRYTMSRIKRAALHAALNHVKTLSEAPVDYARVLAVRKDRTDLLKLVNSSPSDSLLYSNDLYADEIYRIIGGMPPEHSTMQLV